jgi:hypothetical protein
VAGVDADPEPVNATAVACEVPVAEIEPSRYV